MLLFLERASGTICSTMGSNFTLRCTLPLSYVIFPPVRPPNSFLFCPVPMHKAIWSSREICLSDCKQIMCASIWTSALFTLSWQQSGLNVNGARAPCSRPCLAPRSLTLLFSQGPTPFSRYTGSNPPLKPFSRN